MDIYTVCLPHYFSLLLLAFSIPDSPSHFSLFPPPISTLLLLEQSSAANECLGMDFLLQAAERGMKLAMLEVAKAYDTGFGLGKAPEGDSSFPAKQR